MPNDLKWMLAKLAATLNYLADRCESYEDVDEDGAWMRDGVDPVRNPPARGAQYAMANLREIMREIREAEDLADAAPASDAIREVKEALCLAWNAIGQADVAAEMAVLAGDEAQAVECCRNGLRRAWERCGWEWERLGAKLGVMARDASRTARTDAVSAVRMESNVETEDTGNAGGPEPDPHDTRKVVWYGKRIYLGKDTQVSRLFWLLARPVGAARKITQLQEAIDGMITTPDMHPDDVRKASQRLWKVVHKLRCALQECGLDDHVVITKHEFEYSMVFRFAK